MISMRDVQIRPARASDDEELAPQLKAPWPRSSAEEHARDLQQLLGGKAAAVMTMPLAIFVPEAEEALRKLESPGWLRRPTKRPRPVCEYGTESCSQLSTK
jgi:hypothetical protein